MSGDQFEQSSDVDIECVEKNHRMHRVDINILHPLIMSILKHNMDGISEYLLIKALSNAGVVWPEDSESPDHALFQKHFITMNALYSLQDKLRKESIFLDITALKIKLYFRPNAHQSDSCQNLKDTDYKLKTYYLDWHNYHETGTEEVVDLLNQFWTYYQKDNKKEDSFKVLGIPPSSTKQEIDFAFRRLAALHHPDKGGEAKAFIQIRQAYEVLSDRKSRFVS